ncbi:helix-turn-helix transcriptional regulator [Microbacterium sp. NEAU-LLC]|uniref:Helix-turn-helix transcriptional regulator n=1 Tax=Microbacterium helvum TaxID=2773713 RepID=A0ABR8NQ10_9MICO|nr:XRE family transcriptional regulator [Microbacterium helvum]MBD3942730.1 helix-turn-helix transcriptional regulator [Microbacterium helvum]
MSQISATPDELDVGGALRSARERRGWSGGELAAASGVSRAMIDRIERGASSPTATLLGRLATALGLTVSNLLSRPAAAERGVLRAAERAFWTDPDTGYRRRQVAATPAFPVDVTEVTLPPGARVAYPAETYAFSRHLVWVTDGTLTFHEGVTVHRLTAGDRLVLGEVVECAYENSEDEDCTYVVVVAPV